LSENVVRRGSLYNVNDLIGAILQYVNQHNDDPKPFIWRGHSARYHGEGQKGA